MTKEEWVKEVMNFVNYHDGGHIEPYVADKLADYLVGTLGMLPPPYYACAITREPKERGELTIYDWEKEPMKKKAFWDSDEN